MNIYEFLNNNLKPGLHYRVYPDKNTLVIFRDNKALQNIILNNEVDLELGNYVEKYGNKLFKSSSLISVPGIKGFQKNYTPEQKKKPKKLSLAHLESSSKYDYEPILPESKTGLLNKIKLDGCPVNLLFIGNNKYVNYRYKNNKWVATEVLEKIGNNYRQLELL